MLKRESRSENRSENRSDHGSENKLENTAQENEVKHIKKIAPASETQIKAEKGSTGTTFAGRPPRLGGCIPVSGD
jgi:hypothetical protein